MDAVAVCEWDLLAVAKKSSLSFRLVPLVEPRSVTVSPESRIRKTACWVDTPRSAGWMAEVDLGLDALVAVVPSDQVDLAPQSDPAFGEDLRELDGVGSAAARTRS